MSGGRKVDWCIVFEAVNTMMMVVVVVVVVMNEYLRLIK
jgi:hypothetical protein